MPAQYTPPLVAPTSSAPPGETTPDFALSYPSENGRNDMAWAEQVFAPTLPATASQGSNDDKEGNTLATNNYISGSVDFMKQLQTDSPNPDAIQPLVQGRFPSSASYTDSTGQNMPSASNDQPTFPNVMQANHDNQQGFHGVKETTQTTAQMFGTGAFNIPTQAANAQATGVGQWTQQTPHDAHQGCYGPTEALYSKYQAFNNVQAMYDDTQHQQIFKHIPENIETIFNTAMQTTGHSPQLEVDLPRFLQHAMQPDNMSQNVTGALPTPILPPLRPRPNQTPYMSGEHNCRPCGLGFASKPGLKKHEGRAKHNARLCELNPDAESHVQKVLCVYCGGGFADAYTLSRHQKSQHGEFA